MSAGTGTGGMETGLDRLRTFVREMTALVAAEPAESEIIERGGALLGKLVAVDDWLPAEFAAPHPEHYQQYLLHCDPLERFSLVSFVWGPGQRTPVHDHTVWGLIGVLRGAENCRNYAFDADGRLQAQPEQRCAAGEVTAVSPRIGDIHVVANALTDRPSISIHAYGANIGAVARHVFDPASGQPTAFVSGYAGTVIPNIWDRSAAIRRRLGI